MLITTEVVRDVLCNEVMQLNKCIEAQPSAMTKDIKSHIINMIEVLMSQQDFVHVPLDVKECDLQTIANIIIVQKGMNDEQ